MSDKKVKLHLKLSHPADSFRLGSHKITKVPDIYELNEEELKELSTKGPSYWLVKVEDKKKVAPAKDKNS